MLKLYHHQLKDSAPANSTSEIWLTVIASFNGANGAKPWGSLIADSAGNFYGTTSAG
jgi:hypothetical protein